jgi:hypothetical protein
METFVDLSASRSLGKSKRLEIFSSECKLSDELASKVGRSSVLTVVAYERGTSPLRPVVYATLDSRGFDPKTGEQEVLWLETSCEYRRHGYATELIEKLDDCGWKLRIVPGSDVGGDFIDALEAKHPDWFQ